MALTTNVVFYFALVSILILVGGVVAVLVITLQNKNDISNLSSKDIVSVTVGPTLTKETNVETALTRLNKLCTASSIGLMDPIEKIKLSTLNVPNGGSLVFDSSAAACCSIFTGSLGSTGSGFVVEVNSETKECMLVTAAHVILSNGGETTDFEIGTNITATVAGANNDPTLNIQVSCTIVGFDAAADLAVLRTNSKINDSLQGFDFTADQKLVSFTDSTVMKKGIDVYCIGDPLGQDDQSISAGVLRDNKFVSSSNGGAIENISFSAPILKGNSGGPVFNNSGQVIGLSNYVFAKDGQSFSAFAGGVNSYMASRIYKQLVAPTPVKKGFLGVSKSQTVSDYILQTLRIENAAFGNSEIDYVKGVVLQGISGGLFAAGVQDGDILLKVDDVDVGIFKNQFSPTRVSWFKNGEKIKVEIGRPSTGNILSIADVLVGDFPVEVDVVFTSAF